MENGYVLRDFKFGSPEWGTSGGQVTWSFASTVGVFFAFDAIISQPYYQNMIVQAFQAWENVADIDFVQVADSAASDIRLGWDEIDVPAHFAQQVHTAYTVNGTFEITSEIRFDPVKTANITAETFLGLAMHEIGHAIGLDHIDDQSLIMNPIVYISALSVGDIAGAQFIYGSANGTDTPVGWDGSSWDDSYEGGAAGEAIKGHGGDDRLRGNGGNDNIDGGDGLDFAIYVDSAFNYDLHYQGSGTLSVAHRMGQDGTDLLSNIERVAFPDFTLALDIDGIAGQAYRVYQAAFDRAPDPAGLGFWIREMDAGLSLYEVSRGFVASQEFGDIYGYGASNASFVAKLYNNVLGRDGESAGLQFWGDLLSSEKMDKAAMLASFSESPENMAGVAPAIQSGFWYF
ncbi:DUF4214 domain-containing protein [Rhizobium sp. LjRoot30]|uniref:DUF4214 domain-containing protein n=1 Tax=Rhizobium sp. LjRoot30 TaxID=3342320 RepID=UPI003ECC302E